MSKNTILITGGSGFLGRRLALALRDTHRVVLAARRSDQLDVAKQATGCDTRSLDVTNVDSVRSVIAELAPDAIVHAAGNKYVQVCEREPFTCIDANLTGPQNVARVAMERGVRAVVGISSDTAAPPTQSTYGLAKATAERLFCSLGARVGTRFTTVRLGNIAWSTGSVFPVWQKMITDSGTISTTGPEETRFFLTGDAASRAVLTALTHVDVLSGRVLVPQMKTARIRDLLELWVRQRGGAWKPASGNGTPAYAERLIGDLELPYTREQGFDGAAYYVISFNEKAAVPLREGVTTASATRVSESELLALLEAPVGGA